MDTSILEAAAIAVAHDSDTMIQQLLNEPDNIMPETAFPGRPRFGITDLWKIHGTRRSFSIYRSSI